MYIRKNKVNKSAIDHKLETYCNEILELNKDAFFAISKKFVEKKDESLKKEIEGSPVIVSSKPIEELVIPSGYDIKFGDYLTTWCDKDPLVKIIYSNMIFTDGYVNGKLIENLYLFIDKEEEFKKSKNFVSFENF